MTRIIKILAVDREEIILRSIRKALKNDRDAEYLVSTCSTALDGLKIIRSDKFDIVFVDLVLPGMNGIEVLRRIKNIYPGVAVILMSGFSSAGIHVKTGEKENNLSESLNHPDGLLLKPFTSEEIKSITLKVLKQNL